MKPEPPCDTRDARIVPIVLALLAALGAWLVWSTSGKAQDDDRRWLPSRSCEWAGTCYRHRYAQYDERRRALRRHWREPRYYRPPAYQDDGDRRFGRACRDVRRAVGDQHLTVEGAKKNANDAWAATVRFHIGEKWLDLTNAREVSYTCSRSSIKEAGSSVTTLGQAFYRCEIVAQPCAPEREVVDR